MIEQNPIHWTNEQLRIWINTYDHGKFQPLLSASSEPLASLTGHQLFHYTNEQWKALQPHAIARSLRYTFMGICAIQQASLDSNKSTTTYNVNHHPSRGRVVKERQKDTDGGHPSEMGDDCPIPNTDISLSAVYHLMDDEEPTTGNERKPVPFPPIIALPTPTCLFCTSFGVTFGLYVLLEKTSLLEIMTWQDLVKYASIPVISMIFTYFHIWLALYLTFYPLAFEGCNAIRDTNVGCLGWQGIIPYKAEKMARLSVKLITTKLLSVQDIFARLEPARVTAEIEPRLVETIQDIIEVMAARYHPQLWHALPHVIRDEICARIREECPEHITTLMRAIHDNIEHVFDLEDMIVSKLTQDKQLLVNMFLTCGYAELCFIRNTGAYMGGFFGLVQMIVWHTLDFANDHHSAKLVLIHRVLIFPLFGLVVGLLTNYLALKMIFEPVEPQFWCFGLFRCHGLFLRRQEEVAHEYGRMVATDLLNGQELIEAIIKGAASDRLFQLVYAKVRESLDDTQTTTGHVLSLGIGRHTYLHMKDDICGLILQKFPHNLRLVKDYAFEALDLEATLAEKMKRLSSQEFEQLLHPVFQEDEWKLILMGGVLGLVIGLIQAFGINV